MYKPSITHEFFCFMNLSAETVQIDRQETTHRL